MPMLYSNNGEDFTTERDEVSDYIRDENKDGQTVEFWTADGIPAKHDDVLTARSVDCLIESLQELAYDEAGEHAQDYLSDLDAEGVIALRNAIIGALSSNAKAPSYLRAENIKKITGTLDGRQIRVEKIEEVY